jgi:hypothetical protein
MLVPDMLLNTQRNRFHEVLPFRLVVVNARKLRHALADELVEYEDHGACALIYTGL